MSKPVILSGIQPTGNLNIGTYTGALRNWVSLQSEYQCMYMIVDLHSLTVRPDPGVLKEMCLSFAAQYLACGIDPKESTIFLQSQVPQHCELAWILSCYTGLGELQRMTQFKDKSKKNESNINAGLLTYPVLMAADILIYQADLVPVGEDQKQHLELTRDVAARVNSHFDQEIFKIPEPFIPKVGAKIMSLQDPESKMSKSDVNEKSNVWLLDTPKKIEKKLKSAVTDSGEEIYFDPVNKPGVSNLLTIYSVISALDMDSVVKSFEGKKYGHLKVETAQKLIDFLAPVQEEYNRLRANEDYLMDVLNEGSRRAREKAQQTLGMLQEKLGLISRS